MLDKLKPKTKNQKNFVGVNENSTTFLYTLNRGGQENIFLEGEKSFLVLFFKVYYKVEMLLTRKFGF